MPLTNIRELVKQDYDAVNQLIAEHLQSDIGLIDELCQHIINSGGKRLRPLLVLLSANACAYQGQHHIYLAMALEFFHTATLLHDDVVDESSLRRGRTTANQIWGSKASILVGDYLFTKAFQVMVETGNLKVLDLLANTANTITQGEVRQLVNCHDAETSEARYMDVIRDKTAVLFAAAAQIGGIVAQSSDTIIQALNAYGMHLGNAFQLIDDALDYCSSAEELGKNIGDDLAEGKPTLPLIYALHHSSKAQQELIRNAINQGTLQHIDAIMAAINESKAIDYTYAVAKQQIDAALTALQILPATPYRSAMQQLAEYALQRKH